MFTNVTREHGCPFTYDFERHARRTIATGISSNLCQEMFQLHMDYLLKNGDKGKVVVPHKRWYSKQREAVGIEAWAWAMIKVAGAEWVLQCAPGCVI